MSVRRAVLILASCVSVSLLSGLGAVASAALPAGRPYELVSPAEKRGPDVVADSLGGVFGLFSPLISADGNSVAFSSQDAFPGSASNGIVNRYRARRSAAGWATTQLDPAFNPPGFVEPSAVHGFDETFDSFVFAGMEKTPLTPDASPGFPNLYLLGSGGPRLITVGANASGLPVASAANLSHVVFSTSRLIGEDAQRGNFLYDWDAGTGRPTLVEPSPDGIPPEDTRIATPPEINFAGIEHWNPVSRDGSRILFVVGGPKRLFVRIDGRETKHVSASQRILSDPNGPKPANFRFASDNGSRVFFTSAEKLTNDATTGQLSGGEDLYRYDVASGQLVDLTAAPVFDPNSPNGAEVQGVLGGAQDGSRIYFVARGVLAPGARADAMNLYQWRDGGGTPNGTIFHIATGVDPTNWTNELVITDNLRSPKRLTSRVTPDGSRLLFASTSRLTGFPNAGHFQTYLFEVGRGLRCVSCNPAGTPATADALAVGTGDTPLRPARSLTDDGRRVFFTSNEGLLAEDTNGVADVYQWDAATGALSLISDGTSPFPAFFSDATPSGSDVVFVTRAQLLPVDLDGSLDAYDARIGGGLASQQSPPPVPPCTGADCRVGFGLPPAPVDAGSRAAVAEPPPPQAPPKKKKKKKRKHRRGNRR